MFLKNSQIPEGKWIMNYGFPLRHKDGMLAGGISILKEIAGASNKGLPSLETYLPPMPLDD